MKYWFIHTRLRPTVLYIKYWMWHNMTPVGLNFYMANPCGIPLTRFLCLDQPDDYCESLWFGCTTFDYKSKVALILEGISSFWIFLEVYKKPGKSPWPGKTSSTVQCDTKTQFPAQTICLVGTSISSFFFSFGLKCY